MNSNDKSAPIDQDLIKDLLESLDNLFGLHPGFRPVHAKGVMCSGEFVPTNEARALTRAPHISRDATPIVLRFSNFAGVPTIPDNDPNGAGPRGFAVRFYLGAHEHTDIVGHSHDGFPVRTGEEFLGFARALVASGPDAEKPTLLDKFLQEHPSAKRFVETPNPIPSSYAREHFFGVNAVKFTDSNGRSKFGRYKIRPEDGTDYLSTEDAAAKSDLFLADELGERLKNGSVKMNVFVQIAAEGDKTDDATFLWPSDREEIKFGTITLTSIVDSADPEMRKIIFDPIPRVDGIEPSADPLIEVRSQIYIMSGRRRRQANAETVKH